MYCMELLIPESGREGWDYERRGNEKQLFKELPGSREKQRTRLNQRQKARLLLIFFCGFSGGDSHTWSDAS